MSRLVPLKGVGAPTHEYDIAARRLATREGRAGRVETRGTADSSLGEKWEGSHRELSGSDEAR